MNRTGNRKTIRLQEYDYSSPGEYFLTICSQDKLHSFGEVIGEEMRLSSIGEIAQRCWQEIPDHFSNVELDAYEKDAPLCGATFSGLRLPNHVHGIIVINESRRDVVFNVPERLYTENDLVNENNNPKADVQLNVPTRLSPRRGTLSVIIRTFKAAVTLGCRRKGYTDFRWQRNYLPREIAKG